MDEMLSYCGLLCNNCPIFLATRESNESKQEEMKIDIINLCKEHYNVDYNFDDINGCDGCTSDSGQLFTGCKNCEIRKCIVQKGLSNCAYCEEYACDNLLNLFKTDPTAKIRLDFIRTGIY